MLASIKNALNNIAQQQKSNSQAKDNLKGYKTSLIRMLADMRLDPHEIAALQSQQRGLALDPQSVQTIHRDVVVGVIDHIFADGVVTQEELNALNQISSVLAVSSSSLPQNQLFRLQMAVTVLGIQQGRLPSIPPIQLGVNIMPGEIFHCYVPCQILDERTYRVRTGGSSGVSVRIAKGLYYRVGSSRSRSIPVTQIVPVDAGTFVITSKRLIYKGTRQSFNAEWNKVLGVEPMADGLALSFTNRKKTALLKYSDLNQVEIIEAVLMYYLA